MTLQPRSPVPVIEPCSAAVGQTIDDEGAEPMADKILIVDDTKSVRDFLTEILINEQYTVLIASTGESGLDLYRRFKPDLVLLDIILPGINGYEVCRKMRSEPTGRFVKIIMVSTKNRLEERLDGYSVGADDYLSKPFEKDELLAKVRVFLHLKSVEDQLRELNDTLNEQVRIRTSQVLEAEKMATLGRHTAGIVHNLNNPLGVIMSTSELLTLRYPDEKHILMQRKAASQMTRIIKTIMETSYRDCKEESTWLDINQILRDQLELFETFLVWKDKVKTVIKLEPLPSILGVYAHFSQSFSNFITNAIEAMHGSEEKTLTVSSMVEDGTIIIRISDTGHGMSESTMCKIFHPFYTTKHRAVSEKGTSGTGLGLAYCSKIIQSYGGKIEVESNLGTGSTFSVHLPHELQRTHPKTTGVDRT